MHKLSEFIQEIVCVLCVLLLCVSQRVKAAAAAAQAAAKKAAEEQVVLFTVHCSTCIIWQKCWVAQDRQGDGADGERTAGNGGFYGTSLLKDNVFA